MAATFRDLFFFHLGVQVITLSEWWNMFRFSQRLHVPVCSRFYRSKMRGEYWWLQGEPTVSEWRYLHWWSQCFHLCLCCRICRKQVSNTEIVLFVQNSANFSSLPRIHLFVLICIEESMVFESKGNQKWHSKHLYMPLQSE